MDRPAGRAGEIEYESIGPPELVGDESVMAVPLVRVNVLDVYEMLGTTSTTLMVTMDQSEPPLLVPFTYQEPVG